jgi:hypothetical protein
MAKELFLEYLNRLEDGFIIFLPIPDRNLDELALWLEVYNDDLGQTPLEVLDQIEYEDQWLEIQVRRVTSTTTEDENVALALLSLAFALTRAPVSLDFKEDHQEDSFISIRQWNIANVNFLSTQDWMMIQHLRNCTSQSNELWISIGNPLDTSRADAISLDGLPDKLDISFEKGVGLKDAEALIRLLARLLSKGNGKRIGFQLSCGSKWPKAINMNPIASNLSTIWSNVPFILTKPSFADVSICIDSWSTTPWHEHDVTTNGRVNVSLGYNEDVPNQLEDLFLHDKVTAVNNVGKIMTLLTRKNPSVVIYASHNLETADVENAAAFFPRLLLLSEYGFDEVVDLCVGKSRVMPVLGDFCPLLHTVSLRRDRKLQSECPGCVAGAHLTAMDKLVSVAVAFGALEASLPLPVWMNLIRAAFYADIFGSECRE